MKKNKKVLVFIGIVIIALIVCWYFWSKPNSNMIDTTTKPYSASNMGTINIFANQIDAKVSVSSLENSFSEIYDLPVQARVPVGKYSITVYKDGYRNYQTDVTISKSNDLKINAVIEYIGSTEDDEPQE